MALSGETTPLPIKKKKKAIILFTSLVTVPVLFVGFMRQSSSSCGSYLCDTPLCVFTLGSSSVAVGGSSNLLKVQLPKVRHPFGFLADINIFGSPMDFYAL